MYLTENEQKIILLNKSILLIPMQETIIILYKQIKLIQLYQNIQNVELLYTLPSICNVNNFRSINICSTECISGMVF